MTSASIGSAFALSGPYPGGSAITAFLGGQVDPTLNYWFGASIWAGNDVLT